MCFGSVETPIHVLRECPFASKVWDEVFNWCGLKFALNVPIKLFLSSTLQLSVAIELRNALYSISLATLWFIWLARNEHIFGSTRLAVDKVVDLIKFHTFGWLKNRAHLGNLA
ncbi:hypothetical protein QVD17_20969 [Tagetes erecta]|uniref:Reverse transcriptase zinc-binding domain-containing protein n=1 Tax=Tagetes erecta TaxID=13708 RepID=A0AAD8KM63_TARER|nr:hypothetical protein QVD17_20969 [Tagetes erecta]